MTEAARIAELEAENAALRAQVEALAAQVQMLQGRLAKDSHNSAKAPSGDGLACNARAWAPERLARSAHRGTSHVRGMGLLGLQEACMIRYEAEETVLLVGTMVGFLVTTVLLRIMHPTWILQFAAVTYGLLLLGTLMLPFVLHRDIVGRILLHCTAVLLGVCVAVVFIDRKHLWAYVAGALLFVVLALAGLAYSDRRWPLHARTPEQQTSTTEGPEE